MHLQAQASTLEAEAATWKLLYHMYARMKKTYPAGTGGVQTAVPTVCFKTSHAVPDIAYLQYTFEFTVPVVAAM